MPARPLKTRPALRLALLDEPRSAAPKDDDEAAIRDRMDAGRRCAWAQLHSPPAATWEAGRVSDPDWGEAA